MLSSELNNTRFVRIWVINMAKPITCLQRICLLVNDFCMIQFCILHRRKCQLIAFSIFKRYGIFWSDFFKNQHLFMAIKWQSLTFVLWQRHHQWMKSFHWIRRNIRISSNRWIAYMRSTVLCSKATKIKGLKLYKLLFVNHWRKRLSQRDFWLVF